MPDVPRKRSYGLRRLSPARKIVATGAVVLGVSGVVGAWALQSSYFDWSWMSLEVVSACGDSLASLARDQPGWFARLVALAIGGATALLFIAQRLFELTTLRERPKKFLVWLARIAVAANALAWLLTPWSALARSIAGPIGVFTQCVVIAYAVIPLGQMWFYKRWRVLGESPKRIAVVGGGFAGLYAAMLLDKELGHHDAIEICVIDRNNFFLFPPLLPSAATGTIETRQVTFSFRRIFETTSIRFINAMVERVVPTERSIVTAVGTLRYDYLLLAPGSVTNTFGTPGAEEHCFFMREVHDAIAVRNRIIEAFERAAAGDVIADELLRFVIVGAGPTGIEVATEIHDLVHHVLLKRYPEIDARRIAILVVQSGAAILPGWNERIVDLARKQLSRLRITMIFDARVTEVTASEVVLADGRRLATRTCIWCAGVKPSPLLKQTGLPLDATGRVVIGDDLRVSGEQSVFVLGDAASLLDAKSKRPLPPLGQVAFQQGPHAARNVLRLLAGQTTKPFGYFDFGGLVSVGEHYAAVNLLGVRLSGFVGWLIWRTLYLLKVVGFSTKVRILLDWTLDLLIERSITQIGESRRISKKTPLGVNGGP